MPTALRVLPLVALPLGAVSLVALSLVAGGCASARPAGIARWDPELERQVRAIGQRYVDDHGIVGLSIGVAVDGVPVFAEGFGHADAARTRPARAETVYDIASVGKQFTAVAVLQLAERGELRLDQRVREFVPELPEHFPDVTLEHLLRHTSGFVSGELPELDPPEHYLQPRYGLELLGDIELQEGEARFAEGETWIYSNACYLVLGLVVEAASGQRYDHFVREHVLGPLEPHAMTVCEYPPEAAASQRIHRTPDGVAPVPHIEFSAYAGQGSICSSVVDLPRWSRALDRGEILATESLAMLRSPSPVRGQHETAVVPYGMAQRIGALGGHAKVGHTGTFDGGSAALYGYPNDGLAIAVVANTRGDGTPHAYEAEIEIAKAVLRIAPPDLEAARRPVETWQRRAIEGDYTDGRVFTALFEGDELVVLRDGEEQERLVHVGGMRFRRAGAPDVEEYFLMDGDRAGWWVYTVSGSYVEVLRRLDRAAPHAPDTRRP